MTSEPGARLRLTIVLGAALAVRVLAAVQFDGAKLAGDETYYVTLADAVASGDGHPSAWRPPLYTFFLGVVIWVWPTLTAVRGVQIALSLVAVAAIHDVAQRRYGPRAAVVSGLACALCPTLVHYTHFLWSEALAAPLCAGFIWWIDRFDRGGRLRDLFAAGAVLGAMALTKQIWVYFGAIVCVRLLFRPERGLRPAGAAIATFSLAVIVVVLPWTVRNFALSGNVVLISMNQWFPVAMGNYYPDDDWYLGSATHEEREALKSEFSSTNGPELNERWRAISLEMIQEHQPWWILQKIVRGTSGLYNVRSQTLRFIEEGWLVPSRIGAWLLVVTDVIGSLAMLAGGAFAFWVVPGDRLKWLLILAVLYLTGVHVVANATPRFVVPILPIVALYIGPLLVPREHRSVAGWQRVGAVATLVWLVAVPLPRSAAALRGVGPVLSGDPGPPRPDIVLISLDTLRRDAIGAYGANAAASTPELDAFADRAVRFDRAYAPVPFTLSSHMTLFSGLRPDVHGVEKKSDRLREEVETLPVLLQRAGYATRGIVTNAWMNAEYGFGRGFEVYEELPKADSFVDRARGQALAWIDERGDDDRPLFLFIHLLDAHSDWEELPYDSPPAYRRHIPAENAHFCNGATCATRFLIAADKSDQEIPEVFAELVADLYHAGVSYLDHELGALFDALDERGMLGPTLVIVTSDHGEEFQEHGRFLHDQPHEETLAVPLLVKFPDGSIDPRVVSELVSTADLLPTIVDLLELPRVDAVQGRSLLPLARGGDGAPRVIVSRDPARRIYSVRDDRFRLYVESAEERAQLFDLERDPAAQVDVSAERPARVRALAAHLTRVLREDAILADTLGAESAGAAVLDPEEEEWLRSIGYLE